MPSFDVLLIFGAFAFYLFDSGMLLYTNELIFIRENSRWQFVSPVNNYQLLGKNPYIPNILTPYKMIFRVYWSVSGKRKPNNMQSLEQFMLALNPFRYMVMCLFVLLFFGLPLVLFIFGSGVQLLGLFALIYINIGVILAQVYRKREVLMISNSKFLMLLFESFACAPFALNILRKISLQCTLYGDPVEFAQSSFDKTTFHSLIDVVCQRVEGQLEFIEIDNPRFSSLQAYRAKINAMK